MALEAAVMLPEPIETDVIVAVPNKKKMGPKFKKAAGIVMAHLEKLSEPEVLAIEAALADGGDATAKITIDGTECVQLRPRLSARRRLCRHSMHTRTHTYTSQQHHRMHCAPHRPC